MNRRCAKCRIVYPKVDGAGDPAPLVCVMCNQKLVEYKGSFRKNSQKLTVEFGDDITADQRREVLQALQQVDASSVKHTMA